jgi:hypothetical protein
MQPCIFKRKVIHMTRAKTQIQVEYEALLFIMDNVDFTQLENRLVPNNDKVAQTRYNNGILNVRTLINNMAQRRTHRLPRDHVDFTEVKQ